MSLFGQKIKGQKNAVFPLFGTENKNKNKFGRPLLSRICLHSHDSTHSDEARSHQSIDGILHHYTILHRLF